MIIDKKIIISFVAIFIISLVSIKTFKDKIVKDVIKELQKEYSPGPYSPGFDPDKIDPKNTLQIPYESTQEWNKIWQN